MTLIGDTPLVKLAHLTALQRARALGPGRTVVTVIIDTGLRYLNGDLYA